MTLVMGLAENKIQHGFSRKITSIWLKPIQNKIPFLRLKSEAIHQRQFKNIVIETIQSYRNNSKISFAKPYFQPYFS
jgi:hypothetical protein